MAYKCCNVAGGGKKDGERSRSSSSFFLYISLLSFMFLLFHFFSFFLSLFSYVFFSLDFAPFALFFVSLSSPPPLSPPDEVYINVIRMLLCLNSALPGHAEILIFYRTVE